MAFNIGDSGPGESPLSEINIVPFVDVMLVLLIITMITAPFLEQGVNVDLPKADGQSLRKEVVQDEPVVIFVTKSGNIRIGKNPVLKEELPKKLSRLFKDRKTKEVFVRADKEVPYGYVAQVMAIVQASGIDRVGLVTQND
jgi:biopolymer transport protein TolR